MSANKSGTVTGNQVDGVLQDYLDQLLVIATEVEPLACQPVTQREVIKPIQATTAQSSPSVNTVASSSQLLDLVETISPERSWPTETLAEPMLASTLTVSTSEPVTDVPEVQDWDEGAIAVSPVEELELAPQKTEMAKLNWASSQGIECLIFKVAGLKLAIPLPLLGGVFNVNDKVTPLFGQAKWSLGVWQSDEQKLTVVDSAQLIMPERGKSLVDEGYSYLIQLDRAPWALACQEITDTVTLVEQSIKWRGEGSKRPWLAGTVIAEMCALIDVPGLLSLLEENRR
ncbi:chemotaxis protein CheW [Thalassolituus oleivorans]|uniref:chemotaxis protein CheW n=1 Tax=Thalassolituus oleivorans TaxID=187493 RepID=UPI0023F56533|nr:chemotaxis protein CheW [Thalassolituus oleivorans]|tara:strand:- start:7 stop:864 length:858 start_codon:yes stop_codon:yes gene_type:complete